MRRILRYIALLVVGTIALYPSVSMMLIWIDVWTQGAPVAIINIPSDSATKFLLVFFTVAGCALTFGIISYFFLRLLQEDIKKLGKKRREKKMKPAAKETKSTVRRRKRTSLKQKGETS